MTEKLNNFTSLVLEDAQKKRDTLTEKTRKEYSDRMEKRENEFLQEAYDGIQHEIHEARSEANARVLHTELEAKKQLIMKREEIIDDVMKLALGKLAMFVKSDKYEVWLEEKIKKALSEVGKGAKTIYISPDDLKYKDKLEKLSDTETITVLADDKRDFIGGAKVYNTDRRIAVDYSFGEMLSEQKQIFLQSSGLTLD